MAVVGQGFAPSPHKLLNVLGRFLTFRSFMQRSEFYSDRFSEPPIIYYDPTEKSQFSNWVGKAFANFLSKKIDQSLFTINYEAVMKIRGIPIASSRPDLIAFTQNAAIAIEAKGKSDTNSGPMDKYKLQSQSGPVQVQFSVACVTYGIYKKVRCKYHDPVISDLEYTDRDLIALSKQYYSELSKFLDEKNLQQRRVTYQNEGFIEVELFGNRSFYNYAIFDIGLFPFRRMPHFRETKLILPENIHELARDGINKSTRPFIFEDQDDGDIYIDNDRIGLRLW